MTVMDLGPAARRLADLIANTEPGFLERPTPCEDYTLGDLIDHIGGFAVFLASSARKTTAETGGRGPTADAANLGDDWQTRIPRDLVALAEAWRDPEAWEGMTQAGGVDLPGEICGLVALDECIVHGWDVARTTGQPFEADDEDLEAVRPIVAQFGDNPGGPFGTRVEVSDDAPPLDQLIALAGRDPAWAPLP